MLIQLQSKKLTRRRQPRSRSNSTASAPSSAQSPPLRLHPHWPRFIYKLSRLILTRHPEMQPDLKAIYDEIDQL